MTARRLVFWSGVAVLCAWVLVPLYMIGLGAFGGRA
jgi:multiple sugar transport system permease protein